MGPNVHIQCSTSTKQHLRPQQLNQHTRNQHAQSKHSPGGAAVSRSTSQKQICAPCAPSRSANRSAHLHETHSSVLSPTEATSPAAQPGSPAPSPPPANRCLPSEPVVRCNTHESVPKSALDAGITAKAALRSKQEHRDSYSTVPGKSHEVLDAPHAISG